MTRRRGSLKGCSKETPPGGDYHTYCLSCREWLRYGAQGAAVSALTAYAFYRSLWAFWVLVIPGVLYPLYKRKSLLKERKRRLTLQFKEGILVLSSFLSAGYSLENGLFMSVGELELLYGSEGMITEEFRRLAAGVRMNRPAEALLMDFGERSGLEDVEYFAQVFSSARRSGGELVEIIRHTAGVIRDKIQVQEDIHTMTASRIFEQKLMNGLPILIVLYIDMTSPGFFQLMYTTWMGRMVMTACLAGYAGAILLSEHFLNIEI